jgi:hypothetical protein
MRDVLMPNARSRMDAGPASRLAVRRPWPGATHRDCYAPAVAAFDETLLDAAKSTLR